MSQNSKTRLAIMFIDDSGILESIPLPRSKSMTPHYMDTKATGNQK